MNQFSEKLCISTANGEGSNFSIQYSTFLFNLHIYVYPLIPRLPHFEFTMMTSLLPTPLFFSAVFHLEYHPNSSSHLQILSSFPDWLQFYWIHAIVPISGMLISPFAELTPLISSYNYPLNVQGFTLLSLFLNILTSSIFPLHRLAGMMCLFCSFISHINLILHRK